MLGFVAQHHKHNLLLYCINRYFMHLSHTFHFCIIIDTQYIFMGCIPEHRMYSKISIGNKLKVFYDFRQVCLFIRYSSIFPISGSTFVYASASSLGNSIYFPDVSTRSYSSCIFLVLRPSNDTLPPIVVFCPVHPSVTSIFLIPFATSKPRVREPTTLL